jgi:hypothetical protein
MNHMKFYQELNKSTDMIRALLTGITQEDAQIKPTPEAWSILEVTCHLYDEEREDFREHLDFILHRQNEEWHVIHPQEWVIERKYNEQNFKEMKEKFFAERTKSLEWMKGFGKIYWDTVYSNEYGTLTAGEMFASWVAHDNLHVRQLVELRRAHIERITQPYPIGYAGDW